MKLHDPKTEKEILRLAKSACVNRGFEKSDTRWWTLLPAKLIAFIAPLGLVFMFLFGFHAEPPPLATRQMLFTIIAMLIIRAGMAMLAVSAQKCGLYTSLVNLPVIRQVAFGYVRSRFLRKFSFIAIFYSPVLVIGLDSMAVQMETVSKGLLLIGIVCGTVAVCDSRWFTRLHLVKIWYAAGALVVAYLLYLHFYGFHSLPAVQTWMDRLLWIFPPAWILPDRMDSGGLLLAVAWSTWGLWSWIRWPSAVSPGYDKPGDFVTAFGGFSETETPVGNHESQTSSVEVLELGKPMTKADNGWVNRLVVRSISPADRAIAGALVDHGKDWSKSTNTFLILGPMWLLVLWMVKDSLLTGESGESIGFIVWIIPITFVLLKIFPYSNSIKRATDPYPLGAEHVPFFTMLPISIRDLLRISQRVTIIRSAIFAIITTPFFWGLVIITDEPETAAGLLAGIPAFAIVWCFSRPVFIWHRIQAATKRKRGVFLMHCATGSMEVMLFFLWAIAGFAGVAAACAWALETSEFLLIPAALVGMALSAVFARIILEIAINEIRHRRCDWVAKVG